MLKNGPEQWSGFEPCLPTRTLDKILSPHSSGIVTTVPLFKVLHAKKERVNSSQIMRVIR
jgi:hypothetical protein